MSAARFLPDLPSDRLYSIQTEGLRRTIDRAVNSPVYAARLREAGISCGADIASLDDLRRLPFTSVEDLRDGYPLPLLCVPPEQVVRIHASSGTTGKRKILAYTQNDVDTFALQVARCMEMAGMTPADRIQIAVGYGVWSAGVGFQMGIEKFGAMAVPVGPGNLDIQLQLLRDVKATCLCCTASMALLMAEEVERHNLRDSLALKKVIFGSEPHSLKMRKTFTERLGLESTYDIAGMTEMYGPGTGLNCEHGDGIHYWADLFIYEIIDPETGKNVPDGEVGELVVTSLRKEAVPLIRYRTHDLTRIIPGRCICGRNIPRHGRIRGRSDDMFIYRGVNIYPGQLAAVLHDFPEAGGEYQVELTRDGGLDKMSMRIERARHMTAGGDKELAKRIAEELHKRIMARVDVEMADYGSLPRAFGKSRRVTDNRFD